MVDRMSINPSDSFVTLMLLAGQIHTVDCHIS
jgi:hypothetical protein